MATHKEQGLSLLDIGPITESIPVAEGVSLKVYGISAKGLFSIFQRFPEVGKWFKGGVGKDGKVDLKVLVAEVPDTIAAVIAAGCGEPGNEIAEEHASLLPVEAQLDVLEAIARLTFRNGFGPFVQRIVALSQAAESLNFGRASATTSQAPSKPASMPDTTASPSGT